MNRTYQDAVGTGPMTAKNTDPTVADCIASAQSQTDQLIERLHNAQSRLNPPTPASTGVQAPTPAGLIQQTSDLASRLQYACQLTEEVCAAVGI